MRKRKGGERREGKEGKAGGREGKSITGWAPAIHLPLLPDHRETVISCITLQTPHNASTPGWTCTIKLWAKISPYFAFVRYFVPATELTKAVTTCATVMGPGLFLPQSAEIWGLLADLLFRCGKCIMAYLLYGLILIACLFIHMTHKNGGSQSN